MFRKLFLVVSFISIAAVLIGSTSCWNSATTVDSSGNVGLFTSMKISNTPSWIIPSSLNDSLSALGVIAVGSSGTIYTAMPDSTYTVIELYTRTSTSSWSMSPISNTGGLVDWVNMTLDSNEHVQICYNDLETTGIHYLTNSLGAYTDQLILSNITVRNYINIAMDPSDNPHIVFFDNGTQILKHAYLQSGFWTSESVGAQFNGAFSSMAINNGNIHVAAISNDTIGSTILRYSMKSGSTWTSQTVQSFNTTAFYYPGISIAVSSNGVPQILYYASDDSTLRYAVQNGSTWTIQTVDTIGLPGYRGCSLVLDKNNVPHIAYARYLEGALVYGTKSGNNWNLKTIEALSPGAVNWSSLVFNALGEPQIEFSNGAIGLNQYITMTNNVTHISYYDATNSALKHATGLYGIWGTEVVDTTHAGTAASAIALDTSGYPHILYGDEPTGYYWYASQSSGTWTLESVDYGYYNFQIGGPVSLAIGSNNIPQAAYYNFYGTRSLKYAIQSTSSWVTQTIDTTPTFSGGMNSIALDQNNLPYIAYSVLTGGNNVYQIKYAAYNGSSWTIENVNTPAYYNAMAPSIALDKKGNPHITYGNYSVAQMYASRINGVWNLESIDTSPGEFAYTQPQGLVFDSFNQPNLVYSNVEYLTMNYARLAERASSHKWYIDSPTGTGNLAYLGSLALQDGYIPSVAYYYGATTSLNFVQRNPTFYTLPDIKVLIGQSINSAFNLDNYALIPVNTGNWTYGTYYGDPLISLSLNSSNDVVTYNQTTATSFAGDTVYYYDYVSYTTNLNVATYWSQYKQSSFLLSKLPRAISEGTTVIENPVINLVSYLSQSTTYSGSTYWQATVSAVNSADTSSISPALLPNGNLILGNLSSPLNDEVDLTARVSSDIAGTDWDKEVVRVYPVLNSHSEFTTASETTQWAYELPPSITTPPHISWIPGPGGSGGSFGSMLIQFTASNQGTKLTPLRNNWVTTIPNQWYIARMLLQADTSTPVNNNVIVSAFAFNGDLTTPTDIGGYVTLSVSTAWTWYEVPIYSSGSSMYCQIQIKNETTSTAKIRFNKYEIIKAKPATVLEYGTPHLAGSGETWSSAAETTRWAFQIPSGVSDLASISVNTGFLDVHFAGDETRGIKMTAQEEPTVVKSYPLLVGKTGGMSLQLTTSGTLTNPIVLIAVFGCDSVNSQTFQELGAFANIFHVATDDQNILRMAYPVNQPNGYMQMQFKNAGAADFYVTNIYQEADQDLDNYWDNGLFP